MILTDNEGRIKDLVNCNHPSPDKLIDTFLSALFVDGFTERFNQIKEEVLSGSGPRECIYVVNVSGCLEVRRCKLLKAGGGLVVITIQT